jgi:hypothetical protein
LSASRKSVRTRITAGNAAKSSGRLTNIAVSRISSERLMLNASSRSSITAGSGTTSMTTIITTPMGTPSWVSRFNDTGAGLSHHRRAPSLAHLAKPSWRPWLPSAGLVPI